MDSKTTWTCPRCGWEQKGKKCWSCLEEIYRAETYGGDVAEVHFKNPEPSPPPMFSLATPSWVLQEIAAYFVRELRKGAVNPLK